MMNARSKVSSKGQIVVPKDIRDRLGLSEGSDVEFVEKQGSVEIKPFLASDQRFPPISAEEFLSRRHIHSGKPVSIEEMDRAVLAEARRMWVAENN